MVKQASPEEIERYREKILTNPITYVGNLQEARERLRRTGELAFMQKAIAEQQDYPDSDAGKKGREDAVLQANLGIINIGKQMDWLDEELEAYSETVEMLEQSQNRMPAHTQPPPNRRARRVKKTT